MLIDWFTVAAQVFNFLILVFLMKRFLYKPILQALDAREKHIADAIMDAETQILEAQKARLEYLHQSEELHQTKTTLLLQATEEAKTEKMRLLEEAQSAIKALRTKQYEILNSEAESLRHTIRLRTCHEVFAITRKTLLELAEVQMEERMVAVFIQRLQEAEPIIKANIMAEIQKHPASTIIRSAFELPTVQRELIQQSLQQIFFLNVSIRYSIDPDLINGIELQTDGQKIAWSISNYLQVLEEDISQLLQEPREFKSL